jgi:hypothetical protein
MVQWQFPSEFSACVQSLSQLLDPRLRQRLEHILLGVLFAPGRRTVSSWLRAIDAGRDFKRYYYFLGSLGRNPGWVAAYLLGLVYSRVQPGQRVVVAIDDSPTKRYGPDVEAREFITTRRPVLRDRSTCTAMCGSRWRCWRSILSGARSPCRCWRRCTSALSM